MKKKVLLMGKSGSGKTSMRSLIFSSYRASDTRRLGSTLDVEHSHVRFLGHLVLNLWDCGGQQSYMDSYLDSQRHQVFSAVGVLIYVFDCVSGQGGNVEDDEEWERDVRYYKDCLEALRANSPDAHVFCLIHKMDLVDASKRRPVYAARVDELRRKSEGTTIRCFGTSIWDETLYKAWSAIVHTLIPNVATLERHLTQFARICSAAEVVLFERTTFLVISRSTQGSPAPAKLENGDELEGFPGAGDGANDASEGRPDPERFEKISELIKNLKLSCAKLQSQFQGFEIRGASYTAYLDVLTANTYIMVVVADPRIQLSAIKLNVQLGRDHFEKLQAINIGR